ncbi:hypothetical protein L210DRAFT_3389757 [Boletus edulis BED1]|uniref:Uncharacterized protein n=1 Tax=Boletus edulis BED1 TaxID=1328754 RepID=A0AAD4BE54_BOLED|nr:hypothetical protein L210DRAFT_3423930 [Boletus edulis BED1]KAF8447508.1 hypothetical protein L210DRAFT_3389757 [Boletus edulis BED1]
MYRSTPEGREAMCVYVKVTSSPLNVDGLDESVVPIFPKKTHFTYQPSRNTRVAVSRSQLPLVPGWAFTDYKVQGASMPNVVIDLASANGIQNAYVMLSRATGLQHLGILRWFSPHRVFSRLQEDLRNELDRLHLLDEKTRDWFNKQHAGVVSN